MRIAIIRGPSLNKWEMQNYEPLAQQHEMLAVASQKPVYDIAELNLPVKKLGCLGQTVGRFPGGIAFLYQILGDPQYLLGLERVIAGFDIAHVAELASGYSYQAIKAKQKGLVKKVMVTVWENIPFLGDENPKRKEKKKKVISQADHFLAVGLTAQKALLEEGVEKKKITYLPMGVDLQKFRPAPKDKKILRSLKINKEDLVILSAGRLVWEKGFQDLLYAFKKLADDQKIREKTLKLLIVGKGPKKGKLFALVERLGLKGRVIFTGSFPYDQMNKIYNLADMFVLASIPTSTWKEQFGMVLVEAMACGLPVVGTRTGEIPNVIGNSGILVPSGNWQKLTETLKKLVLDERYRLILKKRSRERAEMDFNCQKAAEKIQKIYQKVLED